MADVQSTAALISSRCAIAGGRIVLAAAAIASVSSISHAQSGPPKGVGVILPDVALLIHAPFGEDSYNLTSAGDDSVTLEEFGNRRMRLEMKKMVLT
jgi:hypothetical protein